MDMDLAGLAIQYQLVSFPDLLQGFTTSYDGGQSPHSGKDSGMRGFASGDEGQTRHPGQVHCYSFGGSEVFGEEDDLSFIRPYPSRLRHTRQMPGAPSPDILYIRCSLAEIDILHMAEH